MYVVNTEIVLSVILITIRNMCISNSNYRLHHRQKYTDRVKSRRVVSLLFSRSFLGLPERIACPQFSSFRF